MNNPLSNIIESKKNQLAEVADKNSINYIGLFGSYSHGNETNDSDIDLLIYFDLSNRDVSLFSLYKLQIDLEKIFGKKVDITTRPNKLMAPFIEKDLVTLYENR